MTSSFRTRSSAVRHAGRTEKEANGWPSDGGILLIGRSSPDININTGAAELALLAGITEAGAMASETQPFDAVLRALNGRIVFATDNDGSNSAITRMTITKKGNVGIGTANPQNNLSVTGSDQTMTSIGIVNNGGPSSTWAALNVVNYANNPGHAGINLMRARGTSAIASPVLAGDLITSVRFKDRYGSRRGFGTEIWTDVGTVSPIL